MHNLINGILKQFLIIQTASIGDVILSTAMANALVQAMPDAKIDYLIKKGNEGIIANNPNVRRLYVWDKSQHKYKHLLQIVFKIREEKYDAVFNLQRFFSSGIFTVFSGAKCRYGFWKNPLSLFFNKRFKHNNKDGWHETERNHQLIAEWCGQNIALPQLFPSATAEAKLSAYKTKAYITITPASLWFTKQYPWQQWVAFMRQLPEDLHIYLLGGPSDVSLCAHIVQQSGHRFALVLAGKLSITESAVLMRDALMNYVNDSAAQHIASAVNAPTTSVFCSTVPQFGFGPLSADSCVVETKEELSCRPCGLHGHKACPKRHFKCASTIDIQQLIERYEQAL